MTIIPLSGTIVSTNIPNPLVNTATVWSQVAGAAAVIAATGPLTANGTILSTGSYTFRMTTSFGGLPGLAPGTVQADTSGFFTA